MSFLTICLTVCLTDCIDGVLLLAVTRLLLLLLVMVAIRCLVEASPSAHHN